MEIEERLKDAAEWRPSSEMPIGLEQRTLVSTRPPLRPIGLTRPRSIVFGTAVAGVLCTLFVLRVEQPPVSRTTPSPTESPVAQVAQGEDVKAARRSNNTTSKPVPPPLTNQKTRFPSKPVRSVRNDESNRLPPSRRTPRSPLTHRFPVAIDDSVTTGSRVAVEAPTYLPAYYAQPSSEGEGVQYTPVAVALDDPDVLYSETQQEN